MFLKTHIRKHEIGLLFHRGDFVRTLAPGTHYAPLWDTKRKIEVVDMLKTCFDHPLIDVLVRDARLADMLLLVDLSDTQRALIWKDGRLLQIVGTGRHAFWRTQADVAAEVFDVTSFRFDHPKRQTILAQPDAAKWFDGVLVGADEDVLLYRDGVLIDRLGAGLHVFWKGTGKVTWKTVDRREQVADVAGQEIMTSDKVTLRVNLLVTYQVADAQRAVTASADHAQALYREAQLALRAAVGGRALDALLADKESVGTEVNTALAARAKALGVEVRGVGLRDIILPGDMK